MPLLQQNSPVSLSCKDHIMLQQCHRYCCGPHSFKARHVHISYRTYASNVTHHACDNVHNRKLAEVVVGPSGVDLWRLEEPTLWYIVGLLALHVVTREVFKRYGPFKSDAALFAHQVCGVTITITITIVPVYIRIHTREEERTRSRNAGDLECSTRSTAGRMRSIERMRSK